MKPLVSLCCSTCSRPDVFALSLDGLLRQTYQPIEIVILVDGGNKDSISLLKNYQDPRLRWFSTDKPSGMIPAWNKVVAASKGSYFLFCTDDDVLCDNAIEAQVDLLEANANVGFCHADFFFISDEGTQIGKWQSHEGTWTKSGLQEWKRYLLQPKCCMQTCVVRRELWDRVGGWDEDAGYPGDNSLYLKLLRFSDVGHVGHFACSYRVRTRNPDSWQKNVNKVKEDVALANKHLATAPKALKADIPYLKSQVEKHFARNALVVISDDRATPEGKEEFAVWVRNTLLVSGLHAFVYRSILNLHAEKLITIWASLDLKLRALVKNQLNSVRITESEAEKLKPESSPVE